MFKKWVNLKKNTKPMEPLSWSAIYGAAKTANDIIDESKRAKLLKKIKLLIRKNRKIIVFGVSGAGKTQFINSIKKNLLIPNRTLTTDKTKHELDDFPIIFCDTPGHGERALDRKKELAEIIKYGVEGIINVVSYGYEENLDSNLENVFTPEKTVKESFLNLSRKQEIDRLSEWLQHISPDDFGWIINLVNKADIWWESSDKVKKYYSEGEYFDAFKSISNYRNVITIPYCSIIKPYYNVRTSGTFGEIEKEQMHNTLCHQLHNLLKEE